MWNISILGPSIDRSIDLPSITKEERERAHSYHIIFIHLNSTNSWCCCASVILSICFVLLVPRMGMFAHFHLFTINMPMSFVFLNVGRPPFAITSYSNNIIILFYLCSLNQSTTLYTVHTSCDTRRVRTIITHISIAALQAEAVRNSKTSNRRKSSRGQVFLS